MTKERYQVRPEILCQPNLIKPLHGLNPRTILGQKRWDKERALAYAKNNYHCMACGVHKTKAKYHKRLEAHECYDIDFENCNYTLKEIVPLCHSCHNFIHDGRLSALRHKGEISTRRFNAVMKHWLDILHKAKLNRMDYIVKLCNGNFDRLAPENNGKRNDRGLLIEGKKYYSQFKTYGERCAYYNH